VFGKPDLDFDVSALPDRCSVFHFFFLGAWEGGSLRWSGMSFYIQKKIETDKINFWAVNVDLGLHYYLSSFHNKRTKL